nr:MAG TPA: hypothetical protein [Caudoviricetes sp.]
MSRNRKLIIATKIRKFCYTENYFYICTTE